MALQSYPTISAQSVLVKSLKGRRQKVDFNSNLQLLCNSKRQKKKAFYSPGFSQRHSCIIYSSKIAPNPLLRFFETPFSSRRWDLKASPTIFSLERQRAPTLKQREEQVLSVALSQGMHRCSLGVEVVRYSCWLADEVTAEVQPPSSHLDSGFSLFSEGLCSGS